MVNEKVRQALRAIMSVFMLWLIIYGYDPKSAYGCFGTALLLWNFLDLNGMLK